MSIARPVADCSDVEIRNAVEGYASEREFVQRAALAFDRWWDAAGDDDARLVASTAFMEGYLCMARECGRLPKGGEV